MFFRNFSVCHKGNLRPSFSTQSILMLFFIVYNIFFQNANKSSETLFGKDTV
ncbi:hypothetical protein BRYFOR_06226 [Marvinbryantia formatexigens DSM 14469]|uniref:Uncharacterized protein n=1 Tax=Marvinbryantia formatexigens DSM 14469 TaxID=478749 RepID=C6LC80_9FIRM|nr:hypothetical protein BRYFOR_06226 [Marvinbryantia formatexigens DSM 14469]